MSVPEIIKKQWIITETFREDGESEVAATPLNWVKDDVLFWPRDLSKKAIASKLESCANPDKKWKSFKNFAIIEENKLYGSFAAALEAQERILTVRDTTAAEESPLESSTEDVTQNLISDFNHVADKLVKDNEIPGNTSILENNEDNPSISDVLVSVEKVQDMSSHLAIENGGQAATSSESLQIVHTLPGIPEIIIDQETAEKLKSLTFGQAIIAGEGTADSKIDIILSNVTTIATNLQSVINIVGQLFINQDNLQSLISTLKNSIDSLDAFMNVKGPEDFSCLDKFPIYDEVALEEFNTKLKDKLYKETMAKALRFATGNENTTVQSNINGIMAALFDDNLLVNYSALGLRGKTNFCQFTAIQQLIWQTVNLVFKENKESVAMVLTKMGNYMKYAKQRIDKKDARNQKQD